MTLKDWVLLIGTFIMGLVTGLYLHFTIFVPEYMANEDLRDLQAENAVVFSLNGEVYGACELRSDCLSFQIAADRSFKSSLLTSSGAPGAVMSGTIPRDLFVDLRSAWEAADASLVTRSLDPTTCAADAGGVDFEYVLRDETGSYVLDTCFTLLNQDEALAAALLAVTQYINDPQAYADAQEWRGLGGIVEDILKDNFDR